MELLYLWIEDFRNIKKQGFDFSPEFKFKLEKSDNSTTSNELSYKLTINRNKNYVNLFDGNIINVTGIIGKNGSGKSTLLHCLKLMMGNLPKLICPLIFCLRDYNSEEMEIKTYYYKGGGDKNMIPITDLELVDSSGDIKLSNPIGYTFDRVSNKVNKVNELLDSKFYSISTCYFSNIFDGHGENIYEGIHNISTNYKIESFLKEYITNKEKNILKKKQEQPQIELWPSHIFQFHKQELKGLLRFLSYANKEQPADSINLPKELIIEFKFPDYEHLINESENFFPYLKKEIEEIQRIVVSKINQTRNISERFIRMVLLFSFFHVIKKYYSYIDDKSIPYSLDLIDFPYLSKFDNTDRLIDILSLILNSESLKKNHSLEIETLLKFLNDSFKKTIKRIKFLNEDIVSDNKIRYKLKINDKLWPLLSLIFDLQEALGDDNFLDYSWGGGLSTGEEAYLTHFARLYDLIVGKNKINFEHPILLMIDEGDLYFHPEWQKKYFSELLKYIKFLFPKNKVQIILTTHSPFIASDLPKQNLIFLEQDADGKCIVINNDISFETFGSNIHELYTNSFFLKGGLIGEFAKKQIQEIFDWYKTPSTEGHIQVRNKISIIGEQIIRVKLSEMYASKMNENIEESRLNEQINILKNKLSYYEKSK